MAHNQFSDMVNEKGAGQKNGTSLELEYIRTENIFQKDIVTKCH